MKYARRKLCLIPLRSVSLLPTQATGSVAGGRSAPATRSSTSTTPGGGWPTRRPTSPAGPTAASCSASRRRASRGWWSISSSSCRLARGTTGSACAGTSSEAGPPAPARQPARRSTTGWTAAEPSSGGWRRLFTLWCCIEFVLTEEERTESHGRWKNCKNLEWCHSRKIQIGDTQKLNEIKRIFSTLLFSLCSQFEM